MNPRPEPGPTPQALPDVPAPSGVVPTAETAATTAPPTAGRGPVAPAPTAPPATDPAGPDPLEHPEPDRVADSAATENLLRCWVRETGLTPDPPPAHAPGVGGGAARLTVPLPASGTTLTVAVRYWSPTGHHRFGPPVLTGAPAGAAPVDAVTLAALLVREGTDHAGGRPPAVVHTELLARVADSTRRVGEFLAARRADPQPPPGTVPFLDGEQSLLLGHPLHPTPKSREGLTGHEAADSSPELRGTLTLHWFAVHRSVYAGDSALTAPAGTAIGPGELLAHAAGVDLPLPPDTLPLALHPWQARDVVRRPETARLLHAGLLHDLGPLGAPWSPTSSVRTVHREEAAVMLKLSLGLRITNSRRENLRKELHRGVEVHRLLETGLGARWHAAQPAGPGFDVLRDPAWAAVDDTDGNPVPGLDLVIRDNPFGPATDAQCVAALTAPRPWSDTEPGRLTSRLARLVADRAAATGRSRTEVAVEWFGRYLETVVRPALWLDAVGGIALEAHQQNTVVRLDADGLPDGGWYRDNQGYYFRESHRRALSGQLLGIGALSDTFVPDEVADERFLYYLGINNVLGLVGAFGSQGIAPERPLLDTLRDFLTDPARGDGSTSASGFAAALGSRQVLRCKANLLTRLHGMDELDGPVDGQSVYVSLPNPVVAR
ncbi:IucA/IucC family protein [Streptomyces bohaiensis]|uniref:IucA/IucC family protein n=1 Tax=Streptomyces bohaiensis TaxID=1431344 RepID=UPI003B7C35CA